MNVGGSFRAGFLLKKCGNFGKKNAKNQTVADEMSPNSPGVADFMLNGAVS